MSKFVDARLFPFATSLWLSCFLIIVLGTTRHPVLLYVGLILLLLGSLSIAYVLRRKSLTPSSIVTFCVIGICCGGLVGFLRISALTATPITQLAQHQRIIQFVGTVQADPTVSLQREGQTWSVKRQTSVVLRLEQFTANGQTFRVRIPVLLFAGYHHDDDIQGSVPGTVVRGSARLSVPSIGRPYGAYLTATSRVNSEQVAPRFQTLASDFRNGLVRALKHTPEQGAQLAPGLALGDTRAVSEDLSSDMRDAGLSHLTAVSGANVTILLLVVMGLTRGLTIKTRVLIAGVALIAFVIVVRPQPSVVRAAVMGVIVLIGTLMQRKSEALTALATAVIVLVIVDPLLAVSYGFALSVMATAGLIVWSPSLLRALHKKVPRPIPMWLLQGLVVTLAAQIAVAPLLITLGAQMSLASIPANLICVPLASLAMLAGVITAGLATVCLPLAQLTAWGASLPACIIAQVAHLASQATWLVIPWPHGVTGFVLAISAIVVGCWLTVSWALLSTIQQSVAVTAIVIFFSGLWIHPSVQWRMWPPQNWLMVSCDVGQGDATVIKVTRHQAIVIDVGPESTKIDQCLTKLHITHIPLLVLTHFHADHIGGIDGALHHRTIGMVKTSPLNEPNLTYDFAYSILSKKQIALSPMTAGEKLKIHDISVDCLWPARIMRGQGSDPNNASLVLLIQTAGHRILLAGDVEAPAQQAIVEANPLQPVDVLKISHHGSRNQDIEFAQRLRPRIGFISDGQGNPYGHPAPETLTLYESLGTTLFRTDQHGDLALISQSPQFNPTQPDSQAGPRRELSGNVPYLQVVTQR